MQRLDDFLEICQGNTQGPLEHCVGIWKDFVVISIASAGILQAFHLDSRRVSKGFHEDTKGFRTDSRSTSLTVDFEDIIVTTSIVSITNISNICWNCTLLSCQSRSIQVVWAEHFTLTPRFLPSATVQIPFEDNTNGMDRTSNTRRYNPCLGDAPLHTGVHLGTIIANNCELHNWIWIRQPD